ncbi:MAG: VanZ family protein [Ardenticatenales bacterium]|nr:VanZ family protein [Ardenticatenales bacterium]
MKEWLRLWGPSLLLMTLIFVLSSSSTLPNVPSPLLNRILKKSAHAIGYALLAASYARGLQGSGREPVILLAFLCTLLYAMSDEWHQTLVPGRTGTPLDVLIDISGTVMGLSLWQRLQYRNQLNPTP